jgi:hypothetical protein
MCLVGGQAFIEDDRKRIAFESDDYMLWDHVYRNDKNSLVSVVLVVL